MMALNPWGLLAIVIGSVAALGGTAWQSYHMGQDSVIASQARDEAVRMETLQLAQLAAAEEISKIEIRQVTIKGKVEREVIRERLYRECQQTPEAFSEINKAITNAVPDRESGEQVDSRF